MNWVAVGAISELAGAVAVIVTLIYVGVQIRQNTVAVATATYESVLAGYNSINMVIAGDPQIARIAFDGLYSPDKLSDEQAIQFGFLMRSVCNQWLKLLKLRNSGALTHSDSEVFFREAAQVLQYRGARRSAPKTRSLGICMPRSTV